MRLLLQGALVHLGSKDPRLGAKLDSAESKVRRVDSFLGCDEFMYFFQKLKVCTTKSEKIIVIKKHKRDMKKTFQSNVVACRFFH